MARTLILTLLLLIGVPALAGGATEGKPLPVLEIDDRGEIRLNDEGETYYSPWSSAELDNEGQVQIVQYMAGRPSVERRVRAFSDALEARNFPDQLYQLINIVNLDDVTFGASGFAVSEMEKNKVELPGAVLVADADGKGQQLWNVERRDVTTLILDSDGKVIYRNQGALDEEEIKQALDLVAAGIEERRQQASTGGSPSRSSGPR